MFKKTLSNALVLALIFLLASPLTISTTISTNTNNFSPSFRNNCKSFPQISSSPQNNTTIEVIRIAHYPMLGSASYSTMGALFNLKQQTPESKDTTEQPQFNYTWYTNDTVYRFTQNVLSLKEMRGKGEKPLTIENYDLLYVGVNYWSYFRDGIIFKQINENIKEFLSNGGGYIGSCAGSTFATRGFETPESIYQIISNFGVLKIADVYMNQEWMEEMQYCIRSKGPLPPVNLKVEKSTENPIFDNHENSHVNMTYGGGPGLYIANTSDSKLGEVVPLLTFDEELMETKPIHWYRKAIIGWVPFKKIQTDLKGYHAGVATTYDNAGRIVLFSTHAEIPMVVNGTVEESFDRRSRYSSFALLPRIIYNWRGETVNISRNWWMHRRAAAWVAGVSKPDLPPTNELMVAMRKPVDAKLFYLNDSLEPIRPSDEDIQDLISRVDMTVIAGDITVEAYAENSDFVEFYIDDNLEYTDNSRPFNWTLDKNNFNGVHHLEVRAYDEYGSMVRDGSDFYFINS
ncbi:MAG: BPL-N domain-containing protein [Candidatus Thermoplasmatota archaeon]